MTLSARDLALAKMVVEAAAKAIEDRESLNESVAAFENPTASRRIDRRKWLAAENRRNAAIVRALPIESLPVERLPEDRDALRYRWLRDKSEPGICAFYLSVGQAFKDVRFKPETVDTAIDDQITVATAKEPK